MSETCGGFCPCVVTVSHTNPPPTAPCAVAVVSPTTHVHPSPCPSSMFVSREGLQPEVGTSWAHSNDCCSLWLPLQLQSEVSGWRGASPASGRNAAQDRGCGGKEKRMQIYRFPLTGKVALPGAAPWQNLCGPHPSPDSG